MPVKPIHIPGLEPSLAFASAGTVSMADVLTKCGEVNQAIVNFRAKHDREIAELSAALQDMNSRYATGRALGANFGAAGDSIKAREALVNAMRLMIRGALTTDSNVDGGYSVEPEIEKQIARLLRDQSTMRGLARVVTINRESLMRVVNMGGTQAQWVTEKETRNKTAGPTFARLEIRAFEMQAQPATTQQLLDDSFVDIAAELEGDIAIAFGETENQAFFNGDGVKQPFGIITGYTTAASTASAPSAWGKVGYTGTGDGSGFVAASATVSPADCLINLLYSLKPGYRANSVWLMNSATAAICRKFKDSEGRFLWVDGLANAAPPTLLGRPVAIDEEMPDVAGGAYPIALGDWQRAYTIVDRTGTRLLLDPYTEKPFVKFYATRRVGGSVHDFHAYKLLKVTG